MRYLLQTVDRNAEEFSGQFPEEIAQSSAIELQNTEGFRNAYKRVVSLQAWRTRVFDFITTNDIKGLFLEAQNDALLSVVLAHMAMWRPALQSLRSCIENVLNTCYYVDHPIEFRLWIEGRHRNEFSELLKYFSRHPISFSQNGFPDVLPHLRGEYSTLSKAVHASSRSFHMTRGGTIAITNVDETHYNQWASRHVATLQWLNFVLVILYSHLLTGSQNGGLRESISLAIPHRFHDAIASNLDVHLFPLDSP